MNSKKTLRQELKLKQNVIQQALKLCDTGTKLEIQSTGTKWKTKK